MFYKCTSVITCQCCFKVSSCMTHVPKVLCVMFSFRKTRIYYVLRTKPCWSPHLTCKHCIMCKHCMCKVRAISRFRWLRCKSKWFEVYHFTANNYNNIENPSYYLWIFFSRCITLGWWITKLVLHVFPHLYYFYVVCNVV